MPLPNFIIGGERRGGTTSLYHWMKAHPEIYFYPKADMDYFIEPEIQTIRQWRDGEPDPSSWDYTHSVEEYAGMFDCEKIYRAIGQKDADLLFWRPAHPRLARFLPQCRFIFVLRHPVQRAWSHYWNEVAKGREWLTFPQAVAAEAERCRSSAYARVHLSYVRRGFYEESLRAFFQHIPPDRVLVTTQEECRTVPKEQLARIYQFIGVDPEKGMSLAGKIFNENPASVPRAWARAGMGKQMAAAWDRATEAMIRRISTDTEQRRRWRIKAQMPFKRLSKCIQMEFQFRRELLNLYEPHILELESLLKREFPEWRQ